MRKHNSSPSIQGFSEPENVQEAPKWFRTGMFIGLTAILWAILQNLDVNPLYSVKEFTYTLSVGVLFSIGATRIHEEIHKKMHEQYGYTAEAHWFPPHAIAPEQKIKIQEYKWTLLGPFLFITPILLLVMFLSQGYGRIYGLQPVLIVSVAFLIHTQGCSDDLFQWWRLRTNYADNGIVYMIKSTKKKFGKEWPFFNSYYYNKSDDNEEFNQSI